MNDSFPPVRYRFGVFEADFATGELRRKGVRVRVHAQPMQVLALLVEQPGQVLTREQISQALWPEGTFVDYEQGVNSAVNRLREALGDKASAPQYVETLARRGYRFVAPVERVGEGTDALPEESMTAPLSGSVPYLAERFLASAEDLPKTPARVVTTLFFLLQVMYVGFYVGALANLGEIEDLLSPVPHAGLVYIVVVGTAALLIPVRAFLINAVLFRAPRFRVQYRGMWWGLLAADLMWALAPFLLLHHISGGLALACMTLLVYSPFAQRSLVLMGAGDALTAKRG